MAAAGDPSENRSPEWWRQQLFKQGGTASTSSGKYQTRKQRIQTLRDIERQATSELLPEELQEADDAETLPPTNPLPEKLALAVSSSLGYPSKPQSPPGRTSQQGFPRPYHKSAAPPASGPPPAMPNTGSIQVASESDAAAVSAPLASLKQEPVADAKPQPPPALAPQRPRSLGRPMNSAAAGARLPGAFGK
mmetsp:Transcript_62173/g.115379  ORF Transcript_62173/g.115379 Transcript_62173/m.115379 type:complete len:192 (-) Transcript_62173:13-588(-)